MRKVCLVVLLFESALHISRTRSLLRLQLLLLDNALYMYLFLFEFLVKRDMSSLPLLRSTYIPFLTSPVTSVIISHHVITIMITKFISFPFHSTIFISFGLHIHTLLYMGSQQDTRVYTSHLPNLLPIFSTLLPLAQ